MSHGRAFLHSRQLRLPRERKAVQRLLSAGDAFALLLAATCWGSHPRLVEVSPPTAASAAALLVARDPSAGPQGRATPAGAARTKPACSCPPQCTAPVAAGASADATFLVRWSREFAPEALDILNAHPEIVKRAEPIDGYQPRNLYLVQVERPHTARRLLRQLHGVELVELNYHHRAQSPPPTPNDPGFAAQWNLHAPQSDIDLNAPEAWRLLGWPKKPLKSHGVVIAVVDSGVDVSHRDLVGRISSQRANLMSPTPTSDVTDEYGHGTAMAGIIAANGNNKLDVAGLMWDATIVPCKMAAGDTADLAASVRCLRWISQLADNGMSITAVNYSFTSNEGCSCELEDEIRRLRDRGILFVAASDGDTQHTNDGFSGGVCPVFPAANRVSNVIAVTASDADDNVIGRGGKRSVHVAAPGRDIKVLWRHEEMNTNTIPGTSPATAQVTGLIALLKAQRHQRDWRALRNLVIAGGVPLDAQGIETISNRRIRAWDKLGRGSMTCQGQLVRRRLLPVEDSVTLQAGQSLLLKALSIKCASPVAVPVWVAGGSASPGRITTPPSFSLRDDGQFPDEAAGDGEFAALWTPGSTGAYTLRFWNPRDPKLETEKLKVAVTAP
jgi:hypothetical protein